MIINQALLRIQNQILQNLTNSCTLNWRGLDENVFNSAAPAVSLDALLKSLPAVRSAAKSPSRLQQRERDHYLGKLYQLFWRGLFLPICNPIFNAAYLVRNQYKSIPESGYVPFIKLNEYLKRLQTQNVATCSNLW